MAQDRYVSRYGTGGLDVRTASGGWLGSFPGRGALLDAVRPLQGDGAGPAAHVEFFLTGRPVGRAPFRGAPAAGAARVSERWTARAHGPRDHRFDLSATRVNGAPIDADLVARLRAAVDHPHERGAGDPS